MAEKQLSEEQIAAIISPRRSNSKNLPSISEISLCSVGEKVFFEPPTFSEADWAQKDNNKLPYYIVLSFIFIL